MRITISDEDGTVFAVHEFDMHEQEHLSDVAEAARMRSDGRVEEFLSDIRAAVVHYRREDELA